MRNGVVARLLEDIAAVLELLGDSEYRIRAYWSAARRIAALSEDVDELCAAGRLEELPGIGASIAEKITSYLQTGRSAYLEQLVQAIPSGVFELLKVPGIGPRRASALYRELQISSLQELAAAARAHHLRGLAGMGPKTEAKLGEAAERIVAGDARARAPLDALRARPGRRPGARVERVEWRPW